MDTIFLTGATGAIGFHLAQNLRRLGHPIRILVRDRQKAHKIFGDVPGLTYFQGDITDASAVMEAMIGCDHVFHAAGLPEAWHQDETIFEQVNFGGTQNVIAAALKHRPKRLVYTSTIDVFLGRKNETYDETILDPAPRLTAYERSKQRADRVVWEAFEAGLNVVFLHPAGVYGPAYSASAGLNRLLKDFSKKSFAVLPPGGLPLVYVEDVAMGHIAAWQRAPAGSRYILSEGFYPLPKLLQILSQTVDRKITTVTLPLWFARLVSALMEWIAHYTKIPPQIAQGALTFLQWGAIPDARKAQLELDWHPRTLEDGIRATL